MKVPTIFLPERGLEDKLERIFRKERKRVSVTELNRLSRRYDYYCDVCGNLAGSIEVLLYPTILSGDSPSGSLVINSFTGNTTLTKKEAFLLSIGKYLETGDLKPLLIQANEGYTFYGGYAPFYCLECDKFYCAEHLDMIVVTGAINHYKLRICPENHGLMIN